MSLQILDRIMRLPVVYSQFFRMQKCIIPVCYKRLKCPSSTNFKEYSDDHSEGNNSSQSHSEKMLKTNNLNATGDQSSTNAGEAASDEVYDFDEEQYTKGLELFQAAPQKKEEDEKPIYERGKDGVFDVKDLVHYLNAKKARNVATIFVPASFHYVNYLVFATSTSLRHTIALTQSVRKMYLRLWKSGDRGIILEGKKTEWVAIDMGNIALHIMSKDIREEKDMETLWTVDTQYDEKCNKDFEKVEFLDKWRTSQAANERRT